MSFDSLVPLAPDPVLSLMSQFNADPRSRKIDLGVGVYRDASGRTPVFGAVKEAERRLLTAQTSKSYLGGDGDTEFVRRLGSHALGWTTARGVQTVGGTGALRLAADLLSTTRPGRRIWVGVPTWANHLPIFASAGLRVAAIESFDMAAQRFRADVSLQALAEAERGDAVLLHACCHNPTGMDPAPGFWMDAARLIEARQLVPLVDMAYQGFGRGWREDAAGVRLLAERVPTLLLAYSCDKNFGVYRDRVGALIVAGGSTERAHSLCSHLTAIARASYSMPPDHGAAVVRLILEDEALTGLWRAELDGMLCRIQGLRAALAAHRRIAGVDLAPLARGLGMFSVLPLSAQAIERLRIEFGIYMAPSGRINIAGLAEKDVDRCVEALGAVQRRTAA